MGPSREAIEEAARLLYEDAGQDEIIDLANEIEASWGFNDDPYYREEEPDDLP